MIFDFPTQNRKHTRSRPMDCSLGSVGRQSLRGKVCRYSAQRHHGTVSSRAEECCSAGTRRVVSTARETSAGSWLSGEGGPCAARAVSRRTLLDTVRVPPGPQVWMTANILPVVAVGRNWFLCLGGPRFRLQDVGYVCVQSDARLPPCPEPCKSMIRRVDRARNQPADPGCNGSSPPAALYCEPRYTYRIIMYATSCFSSSLTDLYGHRQSYLSCREPTQSKWSWERLQEIKKVETLGNVDGFLPWTMYGRWTVRLMIDCLLGICGGHARPVGDRL